MKIIENKYSNNTFENIKHIDEYNNEFWYARELQKILEYKDWGIFKKQYIKQLFLLKIVFQLKKIGLLKSTSQLKLVKEKKKLLKIINYQGISAIW